MTKKDSHFIPSPFKVVTEYENKFIEEFNENLAEAVTDVFKYTAKVTASALKEINEDGENGDNGRA